MTTISPVTSALLLLLLAAAPARADQIASVPEGGSRTVVTNQQLLESQRANLLEYVRVHRPQWLRTRGFGVHGPTEVMVYVDGNRMGGPSALQSIPATAVAEVRYLDGREATTRWGSGHSSGAIVIRTGPASAEIAARRAAAAESPA